MISQSVGDPGGILASLPVAALTFAAVLTGAGWLVVSGLATDRKTLVRRMPLLVALVGSTGAVWLRTRGALTGVGAQLAVTGVVLALLAWHVARDRDASANVRRRQAPVRQSSGMGALAAAAVLAASALAWHLRTFAASTLVWEAPVTAGFGAAFYSRTSALAYAARTLVWNEGLVSNGNASFLYGAPTYALLTNAGFSTLTLRLVAAIWALLLVVALWVFARRHFGPTAAALTALVAAANTYVIFYGKYGTSLSATLLACVVGAVAAGELAKPEVSTWWRGLLAGVALFVATLGYSPGRLIVIALLASLLPSIGRAWHDRQAHALAAFAALTATVLAAAASELAAGGLHPFLNARGEQILTMMAEPDYVRGYLAQDSPPFDAFSRWAKRAGLGRLVPTADELAAVPREGSFRPSAAERFEVAFKVLAETVPQSYRLLSPLAVASPSSQSIFGDPPAIKAYFAPLWALTLLGFLVSLRHAGQWRHAVLLAWAAVTVIPVLLTTRFDAHRTVLLAVPFCVWTALGVIEVGRAAAALGVRRPGRRALAAGLGALLLIGTWSIVLRQDSDDGVQRRLLDAVASVPGPVVVGALLDLRQRTWIELGLLERTRLDRAAEGRMLDATLREELAHPARSWTADLLDKTAQTCAHAALVLAPASAYKGAIAGLEARGLRVREVRRSGLALWLVRTKDTQDAVSRHSSANGPEAPANR